MCVALLTYADLSARLDISREAARSLARRRRLPRSRSDDGKALVRVDFSELRYTPRPRTGRRADPIGVSMARIEALEPFPFRRSRNGLSLVSTRYSAASMRPNSVACRSNSPR